LGHVFQPPVPIKEMDWFPEVLRVAAQADYQVA
jgi:hypothetical protein